MGAIPPEPMPPIGVSARALHDALTGAFGATGDALFVWMGVDHPVWARGVAGRLAAVQAACRQGEATNPAGP